MAQCKCCKHHGRSAPSGAGVKFLKFKECMRQDLPSTMITTIAGDQIFTHDEFSCCHFEPNPSPSTGP